MDCFFSGPTQFAFETLGPSATHCQCVLQLLLTLKPCFSVSCRATSSEASCMAKELCQEQNHNMHPLFLCCNKTQEHEHLQTPRVDTIFPFLFLILIILHQHFKSPL